MKPPAFQFYPDDFVGGTVALTSEATGAYILLLCYQWGNGKIPSEKTAVDRIAGCTVTDDVLAKFPNGKNKRLEQERKKQSEYREKQRLNGIASGKARANQRSTTVQPPLSQPLNQTSTNTPTKTNSPSPSPSPVFIPAEGDALKWLADWKKNGADYTEQETKSAFLALSANGWMWGKNPVTDYRAALERQIQTDRQHNQKSYGNTNAKNGVQRIDRSIGTANEGIASRYKDFGKVVKPPNP